MIYEGKVEDVIVGGKRKQVLYVIALHTLVFHILVATFSHANTTGTVLYPSTVAAWVWVSRSPRRCHAEACRISINRLVGQTDMDQLPIAVLAYDDNLIPCCLRGYFTNPRMRRIGCTSRPDNSQASAIQGQAGRLWGGRSPRASDPGGACLAGWRPTRRRS